MDGICLNDFESLEACGANNQKIVEQNKPYLKLNLWCLLWLLMNQNPKG